MGMTAKRALELKAKADANPTDDGLEIALYDAIESMTDAEYARYCAVAYRNEEWKNLSE